MPSPRGHLRIALATALAVGASACSNAADAPTGSAPSPSASAGSVAAGASEGPSPGASSTAEVLRFSAPRLGGGTVRGEDYSNADVAFWFWAPW
jgi:hypothetical protein